MSIAPWNNVSVGYNSGSDHPGPRTPGAWSSSAVNSLPGPHAGRGRGPVLTKPRILNRARPAVLELLPVDPQMRYLATALYARAGGILLHYISHAFINPPVTLRVTAPLIWGPNERVTPAAVIGGRPLILDHARAWGVVRFQRSSKTWTARAPEAHKICPWGCGGTHPGAGQNLSNPRSRAARGCGAPLFYQRVFFYYILHIALHLVHGVVGEAPLGKNIRDHQL